MWVCRAGKKSVFANYYLKTHRIYVPWDGFHKNLTSYNNRQEMKTLVIEEKGEVTRTSISNWAGQLYSFCWEMKRNDYVLIPLNHSRQLVLSRIVGDYAFDPDNEFGLWHSRDVEIIQESIPNAIFSQSIRYSLGAFRTIFKAKDEEEIIATIEKHIARKEA